MDEKVLSKVRTNPNYGYFISTSIIAGVLILPVLPHVTTLQAGGYLYVFVIALICVLAGLTVRTYTLTENALTIRYFFALIPIQYPTDRFINYKYEQRKDYYAYQTTFITAIAEWFSSASMRRFGILFLYTGTGSNVKVRENLSSRTQLFTPFASASFGASRR